MEEKMMCSLVWIGYNHDSSLLYNSGSNNNDLIRMASIDRYRMIDYLSIESDGLLSKRLRVSNIAIYNLVKR